MAAAKAPTGLKAKGRTLWKDITGTYDLRADELRVLEEACRETDLIERMRKEVEGDELTTAGSMGQTVAAPLVQELRQHRAVLARLLGQLKLPDDQGDAQASSAARDAALARWRRGA